MRPGPHKKSTAIRHNNNLHSGKAMLVRPSLYRHIKKVGMKNISSSMYSNTPRGLGAATSDSVVHEGINRHTSQYYGTKTYSSSEGIYPHDSPSLQSHKSPSKATKHADNMQMLLERQMKLKELQMLAEKVFPPDVARQVIIAANYQATVLEDDASLDDNLELLRIKASQMYY